MGDVKRITVGDGLELAVRDEGVGPAVVLLHGGGPGASGGSNFAGNIEALAAHHRVIVPDQPGYGESDKPVIDGDFWTYTARAIRDLLDVLGVEHAHLVGNSLGGGTSIRVALDYPERVGKLVLMGPAGAAISTLSPIPSEGLKILMGFYAVDDPDEARMENFLRTMVYDPSQLTPALIKERLDAALAPGAREGCIRAVAGLGLPEAQLWRRLDEITQPVLLIWGRDDRVLPLDGAFMALQRMADARLHVFPKTGHWAQLEAADEFNRLTLDFLAH